MIPILKKTATILIAAAGLSAGFCQNFVIAQVSSRNGWFTADYNIACAPFTIHITETDTFPAETVRQYSFEGNGFFQAFGQGEPVQYTYTNPGIYKLVEVINKDFTGKTDTLEVTVHENTPPDFTIYTCEANGVTIKIAGDAYEKYRIFYTSTDSFDITKGDAIPSYTYSPGSHQVTVEGLYSGGKDNCGITTKDFSTVNRLIQASFNSLMLTSKSASAGSVSLGYNLAPNIVYQLQRAEDIPAGFSYQSDITGSSMQVDSIDTENKIQIFRIAAYDACQDKYLYSDTLATTAVSVTAENNQNRVDWKTYPVGFGSYDLFRDNQAVQSFSNANISYFIDKDVKCFNTYCYSLVTVNRNGHKSFSDTSCVEAFSIYFPPPVKNTTVSAADKGYQLTWLPPDNVDINEFFVQRILDNDVYSTFDTTRVASAADTAVDNASASFCYSVSYLDQCKNRSNVGYTACSMHLTLDKDNHLEWNKYSGWTKGVKKYIVEIYDETGNLRREQDVGTQTGYLPDDFYKHQISSYRIRAISGDAEPLTAYSNYITKTLDAVINVPNAFTPDGDGLNDEFKPVGTELKSFNMKVYTRLGNLIFETEDQDKGWDGSYRGAQVPQGSYIFDIIAEDYQGKSYRLRGALMLLRH